MEMEEYRAMISNQILNLCVIFFGRMGLWFLTGPSLVHFCCNRNVIVDQTIWIGVYGLSESIIIERMKLFNIKYLDRCRTSLTCSYEGIIIHILLYKDISSISVRSEYFNDTVPTGVLQCDYETSREIHQKNSCMSKGMWKVASKESEALEFKLPFMMGTLLDNIDPEWWKISWHDKEAWRFNDVFFDEPRKKNGIELIAQMYECGKKAGIDHAMFLGYGTALGLVRHGDFVPSDRDMDMCIVADWISVEQANAYVSICKESGLGEHRWVTPQIRDDTGMPLWFSLGPKSPTTDSGVKSCNWFWFSHGGYWWHSKGGMWVTESKFSKKKIQYNPSDAAIAKGLPEACLTKLVKATFLGLEVNIPDKIGACLDHWYPGWPVPKEGASAHEWIMVIEKWNDKNTWRIG